MGGKGSVCTLNLIGKHFIEQAPYIEQAPDTEQAPAIDRVCVPLAKTPSQNGVSQLSGTIPVPVSAVFYFYRCQTDMCGYCTYSTIVRTHRI